MPSTESETTFRYDVFLSYNSLDRGMVQCVAENLRSQHKLEVWLDHWCIDPSEPWMQSLEQGLSESRAIAIFIGPTELGDWQRPEVEVALNMQAKQRRRVVVVALPGVSITLDVLPKFLQRFTIISLPTLKDDSDAYQRMLWGITGVNPYARKPDPPAMAVAPTQVVADPLDLAADAVAEALMDGNATFLLGRMAGGVGQDSPLAPSALAEALLRELDMFTPDYKGMLPGVETVAALLGTKRGDPHMEQHVLRLLTTNSASLPAGTHAALAQLMRVLKHRPRTRTNRPSQQLILTTNYDLNMERALLRAGLPFTRLVHHRSGSRIDVSKIANVSPGLNNTIIVDGNSVDTRESAQLDELLDRCELRTIRLTDGTAMQSGSENPLASLVVTDLPDPILYKFHGSQDIGNSSTISTDQSFEFVWHLLRQKCIPSQISEIIGNSTLIVLGSTLLDYDFRVTYHTLLREPLASGFSMRYAVIGRSELDQRDYAHKLTEQAWERVKNAALTKYRVELLDAPVVPILTRVTERLKSAWGV